MQEQILKTERNKEMRRFFKNESKPETKKAGKRPAEASTEELENALRESSVDQGKSFGHQFKASNCWLMVGHDFCKQLKTLTYYLI
jgi:hypothetical protein